MSDILANLNESQKEAVITTEGPVMTMAGAGSGKTRVLTHRIAYITNELGVDPSQILAVTFTNKAAREMKERLMKMVDKDINKMWVSTFHSMCCKILRIDINKIGYKSDFTILDEEDSLKIVKDITKELGYNTEEIKPKETRALISSLKNEMIDEIKKDETKAIYDKYERYLHDNNLLDFDDLILKTLDLFRLVPEVLEKYQRKFEYILVDEFQDTNAPQYRLVKLLAFRHKNIFIVGDQDQSIYSFRGAKVENIDKFQRDFLGTKIIKLEENYRSTQRILDIANKVIDNNQVRIKKTLYTRANEGEKPKYYIAETSYEEVEYIISEIKKLLSEGYHYKDIALLYRSNYLSRNFEDRFINNNIPYVIYGGLSFFSRKEVKDILAYLRLIINNDDDFSFKRIVNEPKRKIGQALINKLSEEALSKHVSLFKAIDTMNKGGQGYTNLIDFKFKILEMYESLVNPEIKLMDIIDIIIDVTGYKAMLEADGEEGKERLKNVYELKSVLEEADSFYAGSRIEKITDLLSEIALRTDVDNKNESDDVVKLMSYHQSKGLEYKVVFLVAFEAGIFPSPMCLSSEDEEEERRICYVGITRAKEKLYITRARQRMIFGRLTFSGTSKYIGEMGFDNLDNVNKFKEKEIVVVKDEKPKEEVIKRSEGTSYVVGDKINHIAFGTGTIVMINKDIITVAFNGLGTKKFLANHPSITKVQE